MNDNKLDRVAKMNERYDRASRAFEAAHVDREILDNRVKSQVPRIIDMITGLLEVVEKLGDSSESARATAARKALAGKR